MWSLVIISLLLTGFSTSQLLPCSVDGDCTIEGTSCRNENCDCTALDEILNESFTKCLKEAKQFDGECEITSQCQVLQSGFECIDQKCKCQEGLTYYRGKCRKLSKLHENCVDDTDCYGSHDVEATVCKNLKCECADTHYERPGLYCRRKAIDVGDKCVVNADCAMIPNAICNRQACELAVQKSSLTKTPADDFVSKEIIEKNATSSVRATSRTLGDPCSLHSECGFNEICSPKKGCICNFGYYASDDGTICLAELGQPCFADNSIGEPNCVKTRHQCLNGICTCEHNFFVNHDLRTCEKPSDYEGSCITYDIRCFAFGPGGVCIDRKCQCHEDSPHDEEDNNCLVVRGARESCLTDKDCGVGSNDLTCEEDLNGSKTCGCKEGFDISADGKLCIGNNPGLGEACVTNCKSSGMECTKEQVCDCKPHHHEIENDCIPGILSTCSVKEDCPYDKGDCIEEKCDCEEGYIANGTTICIPNAGFGETCQLPDQCKSAAGDLADCIDEKCDCLDSAHYVDGKCWEKIAIGEACARGPNCYVSENRDLIKCRNKLCTCEYGYAPDSTNTKCVKSHASGMTGSIFTILATIALTVITNKL